MTYKEHRKTREFCRQRSRTASYIFKFDQSIKDFFMGTETIDIEYEEVKEQPEKAQIKRLNP
jgi:hypothetical protein